MNTYFFRRRSSAVAVVALLLLFAAACVTDPGAVLLSMQKSGTTADGLAYGPEDIIAVTDDGSGPEWFTFFDGSEHGLTTKHALNAFSFNEFLLSSLSTGGPVTQEDVLDIPEFYMTFRPNSIHVPGIPGRVTGQDIIKYSETDSSDPGTFEVIFDGSDVGLTTRTEKIDGLGYWAPETYPDPLYAEACPAGIFFITTQGLYRVPGEVGQIVGSGFDVLLFCATNVGPNTAGFWFRAFSATEAGFSPLRAIRNLTVHNFAYNSGTGDWELRFSFSSRTDFHMGAFTGYANNVYLMDTTAGDPILELDLNTDYPTLNGSADGLEIVPYTSVCANDC